MKTLNNYSHVILRVLVIGLMIFGGGVMAGNGPYKVKINSNNNGDPLGYPISGTFSPLINQSSKSFFEIISLEIEHSFLVGNNNISVKVFSYDGLNIYYLNNLNSSVVSSSSIGLFSSNKTISFLIPISGDDFTEKILFDIEIINNNFPSYKIQQRHFLKVEPEELNLREGLSIEKGTLIISNKDRKFKFWVPLLEGEYSISLIDIHGKIISQEIVTISEHSSVKYLIDGSQRIGTSVYFVRVINLVTSEIKFFKKIII